MTHFRFERFGPHLLEVCQDFNAKRMNYLEDKQLAEMMAKAEEAKVFNTPSSNNPIYKNDTQRYVTQVFMLKIKIEFTVRYTRQITALIFLVILIFTNISIKMHRIVCIKQAQIKFGYYLTFEFTSLTFKIREFCLSRQLLLLFL